MSNDILTPSSLSGSYRFIQELGKGSQAKVFLAERLSDHQKVTVKQLNIGNVKNWKEYELFQREAHVLEKLDVKGVAKFYEAIDCLEDDPPCSYIIQEYIEGVSLAKMISDNHRFSTRQIYDIVIQMLRILSELHSKQPPVIHRDIKPSNVMISQGKNNSYHVTLIDFGAVANPQVQGGGSTVAGTYGYMPPEQLMGKPEPASDIYALAALAVELFTSKSPANMPNKDFRLIFEPDMEQYPPELIATLRKMLDPDVENRMTDIFELTDTFVHFQNDNYKLAANAKSAKEYNKILDKKLETINSIFDNGNLDLWQLLPDQTPRLVPKVIMDLLKKSKMDQSDKDKLINMITNGRKAIATIIEVEYINQSQNDIKTLMWSNKKKEMAQFLINNVPSFKVYYKFNPPDDSRYVDLYHSCHVHTEPEQNYKIGDPMPILYTIETSYFEEKITSIPFPFSISNTLQSDIIGQSQVDQAFLQEFNHYLKPIHDALTSLNQTIGEGMLQAVNNINLVDTAFNFIYLLNDFTSNYSQNLSKVIDAFFKTMYQLCFIKFENNLMLKKRANEIIRNNLIPLSRRSNKDNIDKYIKSIMEVFPLTDETVDIYKTLIEIYRFIKDIPEIKSLYTDTLDINSNDTILTQIFEDSDTCKDFFINHTITPAMEQKTLDIINTYRKKKSHLSIDDEVKFWKKIHNYISIQPRDKSIPRWDILASLQPVLTYLTPSIELYDCIWDDIFHIFQDKAVDQSMKVQHFRLLDLLPSKYNNELKSCMNNNQLIPNLLKMNTRHIFSSRDMVSVFSLCHRYLCTKPILKYDDAVISSLLNIYTSDKHIRKNFPVTIWQDIIEIYKLYQAQNSESKPKPCKSLIILMSNAVGLYHSGTPYIKKVLDDQTILQATLDYLSYFILQSHLSSINSNSHSIPSESLSSFSSDENIKLIYSMIFWWYIQIFLSHKDYMPEKFWGIILKIYGINTRTSNAIINLIEKNIDLQWPDTYLVEILCEKSLARLHKPMIDCLVLSMETVPLEENELLKAYLPIMHKLPHLEIVRTLVAHKDEFTHDNYQALLNIFDNEDTPAPILDLITKSTLKWPDDLLLKILHNEKYRKLHAWAEDLFLLTTSDASFSDNPARGLQLFVDYLSFKPKTKSSYPKVKIIKHLLSTNPNLPDKIYYLLFDLYNNQYSSGTFKSLINSNIPIHWPDNILFMILQNGLYESLHKKTDSLLLSLIKSSQERSQELYLRYFSTTPRSNHFPSKRIVETFFKSLTKKSAIPYSQKLWNALFETYLDPNINQTVRNSIDRLLPDVLPFSRINSFFKFDTTDNPLVNTTELLTQMVKRYNINSARYDIEGSEEYLIYHFFLNEFAKHPRSQYVPNPDIVHAFLGTRFNQFYPDELWDALIDVYLDEDTDKIALFDGYLENFSFSVPRANKILSSKHEDNLLLNSINFLYTKVFSSDHLMSKNTLIHFLSSKLDDHQSIHPTILKTILHSPLNKSKYSDNAIQIWSLLLNYYKLFGQNNSEIKTLFESDNISVPPCIYDTIFSDYSFEPLWIHTVKSISMSFGPDKEYIISLLSNSSISNNPNLTLLKQILTYIPDIKTKDVKPLLMNPNIDPGIKKIIQQNFFTETPQENATPDSEESADSKMEVKNKRNKPPVKRKSGRR